MRSSYTYSSGFPQGNYGATKKTPFVNENVQSSSPLVNIFAYLFLFSLVFDNYQITSGISISRALGIILFMSYFFLEALKLQTAPPIWHLFKYYFYYVILHNVTVILFLSDDNYLNISSAMTNLQLAVMFFIFSHITRNGRILINCFIFLFLGYASLSALALFDLFSIPVTNYLSGRIGLVNQNLDTTARDIALLLILPFPLLLYNKFQLRKLSIGYILFSIPLTIALLRTGTRGGFITLVFGLLLTYLAFLKFKLNKVYVLSFIILFFLFLNMYANSEVLANRINDTIVNRHSGQRIELLIASFGTFTNHPIFGIGDIEYAYKIADNYFERNVDIKVAHNIFLEIAVKYGALGLFFFLFGIIKIFKSTFQRKSLILRYSQIILLSTLLVGCMTIDSAKHKIVWVLISLISNAQFLKKHEGVKH